MEKNRWKLIIRAKRKDIFRRGRDAQNKRNSPPFFARKLYFRILSSHLCYYKFTYSYFLERISRERRQLLDRETRTLLYRFFYPVEFFHLKSFSSSSRSLNLCPSSLSSRGGEGKGGIGIHDFGYDINRSRRRRRSKARRRGGA